MRIAAQRHLAKYRTRVLKAACFPLVRALGLVNPKAGTRALIRLFQVIGMEFEGVPTFISTGAYFDGTENYRHITLHEGCSISRDVRVLVHDWSPLTGFRSVGYRGGRVGRISPVTVGPYAFIGLGAILMPGASIGEGAIVGAGAVVRGAVPAHSVVVGNPGEIVGDVKELLERNYPEVWNALQTQGR